MKLLGLLILLVGAVILALQQEWLAPPQVPQVLAPAVPAPPPRPVYEWKDAAGRRHFGDQPPPGVLARPVRLPDLTVVEMPAAPEEKLPLPALKPVAPLPVVERFSEE